MVASIVRTIQMEIDPRASDAGRKGLPTRNEHKPRGGQSEGKEEGVGAPWEGRGAKVRRRACAGHPP